MKVIAHRGNDGVNRPNSKKAILNSLSKDYVSGVEFDVRMTMDYKFVINHDPFYAGKYIKRSSLKALKNMGLDSLDSVLSSISSDKIIMIEIKEESKRFKKLVFRFCKVLKRYSLNYYVMSFNRDLIMYVKKKYPFLRCGLLIGIRKNSIKNDLDFNAIYYKRASLALEKETFVWTVNSNYEFSYVLNGQNIITDRASSFILKS